MAAKFELYKDKKGEFRFRLKATNGQVILSSEGYKSKVSAKKGIASVQKNSQKESRFLKKDSKGKFMFNLIATNGQVVGTSERYDTERACDNGIRSVNRNASAAQVVDLT
ncbi:MAG: YegP family protein [Arenicellales bacterium]